MLDPGGRFRSCLCAAALAVFALPTAAGAATQWFNERLPIAEGETVEVATGGNLTLALKRPKQTVVKIPCEAAGVEVFWNTLEGGRDETRSLTFTCTTAEGCAAPTVTPVLPWSSTLLEGEVTHAPRRDEEPADQHVWQAGLEVACGGVSEGVFAGTLESKVGDVDPAGSKEAEGGELGFDDLDNFTAFEGGLKRGIFAANGSEVWLVGTLHFGPKGHGVTSEAGNEPGR